MDEHATFFDFVNARQRAPRALCAAEVAPAAGGAGGGGSAATGQTGAPGALPGGTPAPPVDVSRLPADLQALVQNPEAFKSRLEEAGAAAVAKLLKEAGFKKPEELTAALAAHKANLDAQKTQAERDAARIAEMEPKAALADRLLESTKRRLATLEASLATHKARIDKLAPADSDPAARLEWIENAVAEGLFVAAAPPKPGSSRVVTPSGAPSASTEGGGKKPSEMTDAEYRAFKQRRFSEGPTQ